MHSFIGLSPGVITDQIKPFIVFHEFLRMGHLPSAWVLSAFQQTDKFRAICAQNLYTVALIHHLSAPHCRCFFSLLSYGATRLREYIQCCMLRILKNNSTAEKRREEEAFALKSIAHYCFVQIKSNCGHKGQQ